MSLSSTATMFIGSFSSKNVGSTREIKIVTVPDHVTVAMLVIRCTGHFIGSVYCTDAQGGPWNHPPEVDVLDRGPAYNHLPNPLLQNWIQALIAPFYTIPLVWFRDYTIGLHFPNTAKDDNPSSGGNGGFEYTTLSLYFYGCQHPAQKLNNWEGAVGVGLVRLHFLEPQKFALPFAKELRNRHRMASVPSAHRDRMAALPARSSPILSQPLGIEALQEILA
ncbi:hypothetical protein EDD22DRAFT_1052843 [Suillus occidentalis]|nr:hypothetical protein EDD22DRAFT_1052843 [Suillus occidentalis]